MTDLSRRAKHHLGQNFLIDQNILSKMTAVIGLGPHDTVLEIGPGRGALTEKILASGATLFAVEKDPDLAEHLAATIRCDRFHLIRDDFLAYDLTQCPALTRVLGNIPYNISTPILNKLIDNRKLLTDVFLTTQWEFAQRLAAQPGTKDYGALTCYLRYYADLETLFKISARCFRPVPRVASCFLRLSFRPPELRAHNEAWLSHVIQTAFRQRRKKILNSLAGLCGKQQIENLLDKLQISHDRRADQLDLNDFIRIANLTNSTDPRTCRPNRKTNAEPFHPD